MKEKEILEKKGCLQGCNHNLYQIKNMFQALKFNCIVKIPNFLSGHWKDQLPKAFNLQTFLDGVGDTDIYPS